MILTFEEKKKLMDAYHKGDVETMRPLFAKAKQDGCPVCAKYPYMRTWILFWINEGKLKERYDP